MGALLLVGRLVPFGHGLPVRARGDRVSVEKVPKLPCPGDQDVHRPDRLDSRRPVTGYLSRDLPDHISLAAQGFEDLLAVLRYGDALDPPGKQNENVSCRLTLRAQHRARGKYPGPGHRY